MAETASAINAIKAAASASGVLTKKNTKKGSGLFADIQRWMELEEVDDESSQDIADFVKECASDGQARAIMDAMTYGQWTSKVKGTARLVGSDRDAILEELAGRDAARRNQEARDRAPVRNYDPDSYVHPGAMLEKLLDAEGLDWEVVQTLDPHQAEALTIADKKYEAALWEIANNKPPPTPEFFLVRQQAKSDAAGEAAVAVAAYRVTEVEANKQAAKAGVLGDIQAAAEALRPGAFTGNALCMLLWDCATANKGSGGYYELGTDYNAPTLNAAWLAWGQFQDAVKAAPVAGFSTWRVGNGTAQDKRERPDIAIRSHNFQMNFSVTWKGVNQMIHVGLTGTRR